MCLDVRYFPYPKIRFEYLKVKTRVSQYAINHETKTHRKKTEIELYTLFGRTCKVTTPNWRRQDAAWQGEAAGEKEQGKAERAAAGARCWGRNLML